MRRLTYTVDGSFEGKKAKAFLSHIGCSAEIIKDIKQGQGLLINGSPVFTVSILHSGDNLELIFPDETPEAEPVFFPNVQILYHDQDIAVVNKPPFLPLHQSPGHYGDTLANHFAYIYPNCKFRAITRLDKNTSGLCVIALNKLAAAILCRCKPKKLYYAIVSGNIPKEGRIDAPIARVESSLIKREVNENGQKAVTDYKVIRQGGEYKLLEISLETGRTHQIRVHMAHIGFPLAGDDLYGGDCSLLKRQGLHCGYINFSHPITGEKMEFSCPLPSDMSKLLQ